MPVILSGTTGPEAASIRYAHDAVTLAFNTSANVDRALRQQLLGDVDNTFLRVLQKPHRGYSGSSTLYLLTHFYATYAVIYNANWVENNKRFCKPYLPSVPSEIAWRKIDDALAYADAGSTPYSSKQVTDNAYQLVFNTGIFAADFREWNQRTTDNKTLSDLKTFFVAAHRDWRLLLHIETGTLYVAAHNATACPDIRYLQQETVDAIANLATATASNCAAIAQLTDMVERLTSELVTLNTKLIVALKTQRASRDGNGEQSRGRGRGRRRRRRRRRQRHHNNPWSTNRCRYSHQNQKTIPGAAHPLLLDMRARVQAQ